MVLRMWARQASLAPILLEFLRYTHDVGVDEGFINELFKRQESAYGGECADDGEPVDCGGRHVVKTVALAPCSSGFTEFLVHNSRDGGIILVARSNGSAFTSSK